MSEGGLSGRPEDSLSLPQSDDFAKAWDRVKLPVRSYLNSFLGDRSAVDDCLQEVAILAWKKGDLSETNQIFMGFCLACAKRVAWNEMRKKRRTHLRLISPEILGTIADAVAAQEHTDWQDPPARVSALQECLATLEPEQRYWLDLRYLPKSEVTLQAAAKSSGRNLDAIYKKLERLRSMLRACVERKISHPQ